MGSVLLSKRKLEYFIIRTIIDTKPVIKFKLSFTCYILKQSIFFPKFQEINISTNFFDSHREHNITLTALINHYTLYDKITYKLSLSELKFEFNLSTNTPILTILTLFFINWLK